MACRPVLAAAGLILVLCLLPAGARGAESLPKRVGPHAGYVFPAGAQVGTTTHVIVGGGRLRGVTGARISGEGVTVEVGLWIPPFRPIAQDQRKLLRRRLAERRALLRPPTTSKRWRRRPASLPKVAPGVKLPDHPLLQDFDKKSLDELDEIERYFFQRRDPLQRKRAIEETVRVEIHVSPDARPGMRSLRLHTRMGLSNPLRFRIGLLPESREREPNDPGTAAGDVLALPVVVNGQIMPHDVDRYRFRAQAGERLVMRAEARSLIPYQADSVPGWMQATLTLRDADGHELAYDDEYRFDPDPVLSYLVPSDGEYVLEVRDAIARGRADFVYRVSIGELPFVTSIFPLGGRKDTLTQVEVHGWNLRAKTLPLDTHDGGTAVRHLAWRQRDAITNDVSYVVGDLPEHLEKEDNDTRRTAEAITLPVLVNGRIGAPGDRDHFQFKGHAGREVVLEVEARALGSPLDSLVRLYDDQGQIVAWNDDAPRPGDGVRGLGLQTHGADSYLRAKLPRSGTYVVQVADVRGHGGPDHAYRLRISAPRPDVTLFVTPSTLTLSAGRTEPISIYARRHDGFTGAIDIEVASGPEGFLLGGARVPEGRDQLDLTLTAPPTGTDDPTPLRFVGVFEVRHKEVRRPVQPADNVMQAFLWRHLVPAGEFSACVTGNGRWLPVVTVDEKKPVRLYRGRLTKVHFKATRPVHAEHFELEVIAGPLGVAVEGLESSHDGFVVLLRTSKEAVRSGVGDNLILQVFERPGVPSDAGGKRKRKPRRTSRKKKRKKKGSKPPKAPARRPVGVLPAVPYVIR